MLLGFVCFRLQSCCFDVSLNFLRRPRTIFIIFDKAIILKSSDTFSRCLKLVWNGFFSTRFVKLQLLSAKKQLRQCFRIKIVQSWNVQGTNSGKIQVQSCLSLTNFSIVSFFKNKITNFVHYSMHAKKIITCRWSCWRKKKELRKVILCALSTRSKWLREIFSGSRSLRPKKVLFLALAFC